MKTFIIATNNKGKLAEMSRILGPLGISAMSAAQAGITLDDVEETGETFAENAFIKAKAASCKTGLPAVADDSGLCVDALGGRPGVYTARYAGENATDDMRMDKLLQKLMPTLPKGLMYKYLRTKKIKLNGKRTAIDAKPLPGDVIEAYIPDEFGKKLPPRYDFLQAAKALDIIFEDENILLCNKPQGLLSHPDKNEYRDTLISRICRYLYEKGEYDPVAECSFTPALANRIDRNTGGIVIAAKNAAALKILCEKIKNRELDKRYLAVVHGVLQKKQGTLTGYLEKNQEKNKVYLTGSQQNGAKSVQTNYRVLKQKNNLSLVEVQLITGRTHQIRAHFASIGHPLLGDGKYGTLKADKQMGFNKQALYSYKLRFCFKTSAGILNYLNQKQFTVPGVWFAEQLFDWSVKNETI
mgnify:CR=1 FL=1